MHSSISCYAKGKDIDIGGNKFCVELKIWGLTLKERNQVYDALMTMQDVFKLQ